MGLQGEDGGAAAAVLLELVRGGQKGPFAHEAGLGVQEMINSLEAQVAHGHGIDLGVDQGDGKASAPFPRQSRLVLGGELF